MSETKFNKTLLSVSHVDFSYPKRNLFTDLNFSIANGERVALVGPNGIGKSTLIDLIRKQIQPDDGQIICHGEINYVPQVNDQTVINDSKSAGEKRLDLIENTIWLPGSLLLLDEPTVYLDDTNIQNLLYLLKNYDGAILVASHDLDFINQLCERTIILQPNNAVYYPGNYAQYLEQKQLDKQAVHNFNEKRDILKQQITEKVSTLKQKRTDYNHFAKTQDNTGRYPSRSHDHVQKGLNSRLKRAERELAKLPEKQHLYQHQLKLPEFKKWPTKIHNYSIKIDQLLSPQNKTLLSNTQLNLQTADIIGLIGPNGCGKTTLLKYLEHYINQQQSLPPASYIGLNTTKQKKPATVADFFYETILSKTEVKRLLVKMDMFVDLTTRLTDLSGGEFAKLALIKQLYLEQESILLLDEPTNYLDPESVTALAQMLKQSHLTCIIASHNRKFLTQFCQQIYKIKQQRLIELH